MKNPQIWAGVSDLGPQIPSINNSSTPWILPAGFICQNIITSFHWLHLNNYTPSENKCFNPRNQIHCVAFDARVNSVCVYTDESHDTRCSHALNMQLTRVIVERAIHHSLVMDGQSLAKANEISS